MTGPETRAPADPGGEFLPELVTPAGADPPMDEAARDAQWAQLDRRALLSVHPAAHARYSLYADHPLVRAELATLAAAESAAHPELQVAALVGEGHLVLAVRRRPDRPR